MMGFDIDIGFDFEKEEIKPMTFKESVDIDVKNTFFNRDEFSELHSVNGKDLPVVIDDDKMNELIGAKFTPLERVYEKMILFYVQKELLEFAPEINGNIFFDDELYQVADISDDGFGVLAVTIGQNTCR